MSEQIAPPEPELEPVEPEPTFVVPEVIQLIDLGADDAPACTDGVCL